MPRWLVAILLSLALHLVPLCYRFAWQTTPAPAAQPMQIVTVELTDTPPLPLPVEIAAEPVARANPVNRQSLSPPARGAVPPQEVVSESPAINVTTNLNDNQPLARDATLEGPTVAPAPGEATPGTVSAQEPEQLPARPLYLENQAPPYPLRARKLRYRGTTQLAVLVGRYGTADELRLRQSSGHPVLDQAALDAVRRWKFAPGRLGGEAVAMWVTVPIRFELQ